MLRHEIVAHGVDPSGLPVMLHKSLLTRRWYRQGVLHRPELARKGVERAWPVVTLRERPARSLWNLYREVADSSLHFGAGALRGTALERFEEKVVRTPPARPGRVRIRLSRPSWVFRWPLPVLMVWDRFKLPVEPMLGREVEDLEGTAVVVSVVTSACIPPPVSLLVDSVRPDGVNWV